METGIEFESLFLAPNDSDIILYEKFIVSDQDFDYTVCKFCSKLCVAILPETPDCGCTDFIFCEENWNVIETELKLYETVLEMKLRLKIPLNNIE